MLYLIICTYNITFLIVVMVLVTVCNFLSTFLEGVEIYRFNKCTKVLLIFSDEVWFACWPRSYFLRKILSVGFGALAVKQDMIHGLVFITTSALYVCICMYVCICDTHFVVSFVGRIIGVSNETVNFSFTTMFVPTLMLTREHYAPFSGRLQ